MELEERSAIAQYIIQNKLNNVPRDVIQGLTKYLEEHDWESDDKDSCGRKSQFDRVISDFAKDMTKFAILSHTWGPDGEPSHEDFLQKRKTDSPGYKKLVQFCRIAQQHGIEFAWADTVCIDKRSSSELDESIRSMFTWYRESFICIIYLADTETLLHLPFDRWFARGWTLQELLAPYQIKFYNKSWRPLTSARNDKPYRVPRRFVYNKHSDSLRLLLDGISAATGISLDVICDFRPGLENPQLPERLKWIARRVTTRPEDMSYSMMGILNISFPVAYGEGGERAFFRLFQAALEVDWSPSWFFWAGEPISYHIHHSRIIPSSPTCYLSWDLHHHPSYISSEEKDPIVLTNTGLPMKVLVVPETGPYNTKVRKSEFTFTSPISDDTIKAITSTSPVSDYMTVEWRTKHCNQFGLGILDRYCSSSRPMCAILLKRELSRPASMIPGRSGLTEWIPGGWKMEPTKNIITFSVKNGLLGKSVDEWPTVVEIPTQRGWEERDNPVPKIEFQTIYL